MRKNLKTEILIATVLAVFLMASPAFSFSASNNLRKNGYDAYTAPVRVSKDIQIYRVYIGRFANWDQAHRVVQGLRGKRTLRLFLIHLPCEWGKWTQS